MHELWRALAPALASFGTNKKMLRGAPPALAKGPNGFLRSCKLCICILEAVGAVSQFWHGRAEINYLFRQSHTRTSKSHNWISGVHFNHPVPVARRDGVYLNRIFYNVQSVTIA